MKFLWVLRISEFMNNILDFIFEMTKILLILDEKQIKINEKNAFIERIRNSYTY